MSRIIGHEMKKLLCSPLIMGLCVLSLFANIALIVSMNRPMPQVAQGLPGNVFASYSTTDQAEYYIQKHALTRERAERIQLKYHELEPIVATKAQAGDSLSNYLGPYSYLYHRMLFKELLPVMFGGIYFISLSLALVSGTYEYVQNTEYLYTTHQGRSLQSLKLVAVLLSSQIISFCLSIISLLCYFGRFDYQGAWHANVSSGFNYAVTEFGKPFITFESYSLVAFLATDLLIAFALSCCFCLMGYLCYLLFRQAERALLAGILLATLPLVLEGVWPVASIPRALNQLTPAGLWLNMGAWLTDGGVNILWTHFETKGLALSTAGLIILALLARALFQKREIL